MFLSSFVGLLALNLMRLRGMVLSKSDRLMFDSRSIVGILRIVKYSVTNLQLAQGSHRFLARRNLQSALGQVYGYVVKVCCS